MTGGIERPLVQLCSLDVVAKSIAGRYEQIPEDPCGVRTPLRGAEAAVPDAGVNQPAGGGVNGGVIGNPNLDATDQVGTARYAAELLGINTHRHKCAVGIAQFGVCNLGVA